MTKKIILFIVLICIAVSCGKKGDPKFEETRKGNIENIFIKT